VTAAPFVAELALRATLLIGAAWAAAFMLRKAGASAAARHMAWLLGIAALLALPIIWWLAPPLRLPILRPEAATMAAGALAPQTGAAPAVTAGAPGWSNVLLAAWLIGVAALLLRFSVSRRLVSLLWRDAEPARGAAWEDLLSRVSREMGLSRPVRLRIARGPAMPMTWGTLAPKVLLPAEAGAWPAERRRLVLLHELAHVARRDSLSRSLASLACALYWFHPGAWFAARQMRLEQEYAADDRVLKAGAGPRSYARSLLDLARRVGERKWPDHVAAMAGMCQLERRVVSITADARRERPGPFFLSASAAIAAFVMLAVAAGVPVRPLPAVPDPLPGGAGLDTSPPVTRVVAMPAESRAGREAGMADRGAIDLRAEGRPREFSTGFEASRAAASPSQAEGGAREAAGQQIAQAAQGQEAAPIQGAAAARIGQIALPSPQHPSVYGPLLSQPIAEERASDPRIPALLRRGNSGRGAYAGAAGDLGDRSAPSHSRTAGTLIRPRLLLAPGQTFP
jgi:beta-lactamase regulating signal transducer with metallopeptidase domain